MVVNCYSNLLNPLIKAPQRPGLSQPKRLQSLVAFEILAPIELANRYR
jgi:hypothetical protein